MKTIIPVIAIVAALLFSGCSLIPSNENGPYSVVSRILDATLPRNFEGPIDFVHKNPYANIRIRGGGVKYVEGIGWTFKWLEYTRSGVSSGSITFGKPPG